MTKPITLSSIALIGIAMLVGGTADDCFVLQSSMCCEDLEDYKIPCSPGPDCEGVNDRNDVYNKVVNAVTEPGHTTKDVSGADVGCNYRFPICQWWHPTPCSLSPTYNLVYCVDETVTGAPNCNIVE